MFVDVQRGRYVVVDVLSFLLSEGALPYPDFCPATHYLLILEALAAFEEERRRPRDFSSLFYVAYLHETTGNLKLARSKLNAALELEPESAEANALLGKILVKQERAIEALMPLEAAVAKKPAEIEHRYMLARLYQKLGRLEDAHRQFAEIQRLKKEQPEKDRARISKP